LALFLKTPNPVLGIDDVPHKEGRPLPDDLEYPAGERFTPHFLKDGRNRVCMEAEYWFGEDAAFKIGTNLPKPSALLLHYSYGAAVLKRWGVHLQVLSGHDRHVPSPDDDIVSVAPVGISLALSSHIQKWASEVAYALSH
jgi:hypothetical protein